MRSPSAIRDFLAREDTNDDLEPLTPRELEILN
jgi:hypothetical protein